MPDEHDVNGVTETWMHQDGSRRQHVSREELYTLVWKIPISRLSKRFGLSDVGLRKICVKYDIPTPPVGYWAKRAHGKTVHQPPLPPSKDGRSVHVPLMVGGARDVPPEVSTAQDAALAAEANRPSIVVSTERPAKLHTLAAATSRALRAVKADHEGFKQTDVSCAVGARIGAASIDRVVRIIDAFTRAAVERSYEIAEHHGGVRLVVEGVHLAWRFYEVKDRKEHTPTREELKAQARHDEYRKKYPSLYSSNRDTKVYRSWDYYPSGRLAMDFKDGTRCFWGRDGLIGRWHDRKGRRLEDYLDEAMAAIATGAIIIKHRLAEKAEHERLRQIALEHRRREQARQERAAKRHEFVLKKAEDYARYIKLASFAEFMEREVYEYADTPVDRIIEELKSLMDVLAGNFEREALNKEIVRLQLYTEDDPIAEELDEFP